MSAQKKAQPTRGAEAPETDPMAPSAAQPPKAPAVPKWKGPGKLLCNGQEFTEGESLHGLSVDELASLPHGTIEI